MLKVLRVDVFSFEKMQQPRLLSDILNLKVKVLPGFGQEYLKDCPFPCMRVKERGRGLSDCPTNQRSSSGGHTREGLYLFIFINLIRFIYPIFPAAGIRVTSKFKTKNIIFSSKQQQKIPLHKDVFKHLKFEKKKLGGSGNCQFRCWQVLPELKAWQKSFTLQGLRTLISNHSTGLKRTWPWLGQDRRPQGRGSQKDIDSMSGKSCKVNMGKGSLEGVLVPVQMEL